MKVKVDLGEFGFEGHVMMRIADSIEQLEILEELGCVDLTKLNSKGLGSILTKTSNIIKLIKKSKDFYEEFDLKLGDAEIKSFDDLKSCGQTAQVALMTCAKIALIGMGESEKKSKS